MPSPRTLAQWLAYLETLHPRGIDLGLERVAAVGRRLLPSPPFAVVTVGGTNGKGSVVRFLEAVLLAGGYRVGAYTSPHILRYNERVRIGGVEVDDRALCEAFAAVESVRGEVGLTYFEFGTLAALALFREAAVEVALLEVGLGGRLDAVNIADADVAVVASVDIDHVDWLGDDREAIGYEKAGIFRSGRAAVCGDPSPPQTLLAHAMRIGARLFRVGIDFGFTEAEPGWSWWGRERLLSALPPPSLARANAASALMAIECLRQRFPVGAQAIRAGVAAASLPGRFQWLPGPVPRIFDVAHNPAAARHLAVRLAAAPAGGCTHAVVAMLADKDICGTLAPLEHLVCTWHIAGLGVPRGADAERLAACLQAAAAAGRVHRYADVAAAQAGALKEAGAGDRVLVFGSFHTVAEALSARL